MPVSQKPTLVSEDLLCVRLGPHITLGLLELQPVLTVRSLVIKNAICTSRPVQGTATKARRNHAPDKRTFCLAPHASRDLHSSAVK